MNQIDTSQVNDSINREQPFLAPSLLFIQQSYIEQFKNTIIGLIGPLYSSTQVYILWGCVRGGAADGSSSGAAWVSYNGGDPGSSPGIAGGIFYNNQLYTVMAFKTANINSQNLYSAVSVTNGSSAPQPSPDPITFSDNSTGNVHNVEQLLISQAASGSNIVSGWIPYVGIKVTASLLNGFVAATYSPTYRLDGFGNVFISGQVTASSGDFIVFQLPLGMRPSTNRIWPLWYNASPYIGEILIETGGNVLVYTSAGGSIASGTIVMNLQFNIND